MHFQTWNGFWPAIAGQGQATVSSPEYSLKHISRKRFMLGEVEKYGLCTGTKRSTRGWVHRMGHYGKKCSLGCALENGFTPVLWPDRLAKFSWFSYSVFSSFGSKVSVPNFLPLLANSKITADAENVQLEMVYLSNYVLVLDAVSISGPQGIWFSKSAVDCNRITE